MNLKTKITSSFSILVAISLVVLSIILGSYSTNKASEALEGQIHQRLIGLRDAKKEQLTDYFTLIDNQLITLASSETLIDAASEFIKAFHNIESEVSNKAIKTYYENDFSTQYSEKNGSQIDSKKLLNQLDRQAIFYQNNYIAKNSHPLGSKNKLMSSEGASQYNELHARYHPFLNDYLARFGYYDIFLIDAQTSHVIYSVYKELDYATSMNDGPFKDSGLANVFHAANALTEGDVAYEDFEQYLPSYQAPAAFIGTPIFANNKKIAVLVFQMPIDKINDITTYGQQWSQRGLGNSGETYLVASDNTMRSEGRLLIENKERYLDSIKKTNLNQEAIDNIDLKNTTVGFQRIKNNAIDRALAGESGVTTIINFQQEPLITAYTSFDIHGQKWALVSEISQVEAFSDIDQFASNISFITLATTAIMLLLAFFAAILLSNFIVTPIRKLSRFIKNTANTMDLSQRVNQSDITEDEVGIVMTSFNQMLDTFDQTLQTVTNASLHLSEDLTTLQKHFKEITTKTQLQTDLTIQISAAMEEMATTSEDVAYNAQQTSDASHNAVEEAQNGNVNVQKNLDATKQLSDAMAATSKQMSELEEKTQSITSVLEVIRNIADQTNLLALNAAIEAARAGEQGRGFSVVADEVRSLAQRTQESTAEINVIIHALQQGSENSMQAMQVSHDLAEHTLKSAENAGVSLNSVNEQIHKIEAFNEQMATAATEQSAVARDVTKQVSEITHLASDNDSSIQKANHSVGKALDESNEVQKQIDKFKLSKRV